MTELANYRFHKGITDHQVATLLQHTKEDAYFRHHTSDLMKGGTPTGRFSSLAAFEKWQSLGRAIFVLENDLMLLAGIVWFGLAQLHRNGFSHTTDFEPSLYPYTFAIRLYGDARRQGLSVPFASLAHAEFRNDPLCSDQEKGFWLETDLDNGAVLKMGTRLGYREAATNPNTKRLLMIKDA